MSINLADDFNTLCKNLRIKTDDIDNIRNRYHQITRRINLDFWDTFSDTSHSLYVGSYGRDTEIWTSDIDIIVELPSSMYYTYNNYSYNGQSALLQKVKNCLQNTYSTSDISGDGQVIVINFSDGITFEIVPAFLRDDNSYIYADTNNGGSWKITNPKAEIRAIKEMNENTNGNLKNLCRMIRAWKEKCSVNMPGILIDTLAYNFISAWKYSDKSFFYYDYMSRDFFEFLKNLNTEQNYWFAPGSNKFVYKESNFQYKAKIAYQNALDAIESANNDYEWSYKSYWRNIYGTRFE